ncbi:unnamed protein product [Lepidochelys kempii]
MNFAYAAETLSVIFDWDYVLWEVRLKLMYSQQKWSWFHCLIASGHVMCSW